MLKAGTAWCDISPEQGIGLAGYLPPRYNTGIHDPLIAACFYFCNSGREVMIITMDMLNFSKDYVRRIRASIEEKCGVPAQNIMISCSHTHSGPAARYKMDETDARDSDARRSYAHADKISVLIADTAVKAKENAFEAMLACGSAHCGREVNVGGNRRDPDGPCFPFAQVVAVRSCADGEVRMVLLNYALHPTFLHEESTLVTADYPGYIRQRISQVYGKAVFGFMQGASGDQSSRYFRSGQTFDEARRVGYTIADAAVGFIDSMAYQKDPLINVLSENIEMKLVSYPEDLSALEERARLTAERYEAVKADSAGYLELQNANLDMLGAMCKLKRAKEAKDERMMRKISEEMPAEIMVIQMGSAVLVGAPGEYFVEYALRLEQTGGAFHPVIFNTLTNGVTPGYCYTAKEIGETGYEVDNSMLAPQFGEDMLRAAHGLIGRLGGNDC